MGRRRRSPAQRTLIDGIEGWYIPAALVRSKLRKVRQYADFVDHPSDEAAARLIRLEAGEALELVERFTERWRRFWTAAWEATEVSPERAIRLLREEARRG